MPENSQRRRTNLRAVLLLNIAIAAGFFATGAFGASSALVANGLDNTSDRLVYAISLLVFSRSWGGIGILRDVHGEHRKAVHGGRT